MRGGEDRAVLTVVASFGEIDCARRLRTGLFKFMAGLDIRDINSEFSKWSLKLMSSLMSWTGSNIFTGIIVS